MGSELSIVNEHESLQKLRDALINLKKLCNEEPAKEYNKFTKMYYTPISEVENALDEIFFYGWRSEVIKYELILNSFCVHLRLHVINPATGKEEFTDGLGACPIQVNSAAKPMDTSNIKSAAVQMSLPAAKAYALKDAAEAFGKKFGRDVARDVVATYDPIVKTSDKLEEIFLRCKDMWEKSDKSDLTKDKFLLEAKKQGIQEMFIEYLKGNK